MLKIISLLFVFGFMGCFVFSQSQSGRTILLVESENINFNRANVRLKRLKDNGDIDTFSVTSINQKLIVLNTKEPFSCTAELYIKDSLLAATSSILITHDTIRILFKRFPDRSIVTGGENDFINKNRTLLFALPGIITADPNYSYKVTKQSYALNIEAIPLKFYYEEYEEKVIETVTNHANYAYVVRTINSIKERLSLKTLDSCYSLFADTLQKIKDGRELRQYIDAAKRNLPGNTLPYFVALNVEQQRTNSEQIIPKGKYVLLDFWASWCTPCRQQMKQLAKLYPKIDTTKIQIISISIDAKYTEWVEAIKKDQLKWKSYYDPEGWQGSISREFNLTSIPQNRLIDPQGKIIEVDMSINEFSLFLNERKLLLGIRSK